mmetsp:Transcript_9091/g.19559  ORF Transcript_9091/g.19559 Transcript_9091/m.19559 type:complete len:210 (-) Transcript_9091:153-782(-)
MKVEWIPCFDAVAEISTSAAFPPPQFGMASVRNKTRRSKSREAGTASSWRTASSNPSSMSVPPRSLTFPTFSHNFSISISRTGANCCTTSRRSSYSTTPTLSSGFNFLRIWATTSFATCILVFGVGLSEAMGSGNDWSMLVPMDPLRSTTITTCNGLRSFNPSSLQCRPSASHSSSCPLSQCWLTPHAAVTSRSFSVRSSPVEGQGLSR